MNNKKLYWKDVLTQVLEEEEGDAPQTSVTFSPATDSPAPDTLSPGNRNHLTAPPPVFPSPAEEVVTLPLEGASPPPAPSSSQKYIQVFQYGAMTAGVMVTVFMATLFVVSYRQIAAKTTY